MLLSLLTVDKLSCLEHSGHSECASVVYAFSSPSAFRFQDFAILVKHGFSKKQAILAQFGTSVSAMIGTVVGLLAADMAGESLVLVTAGKFMMSGAAKHNQLVDNNIYTKYINFVSFTELQY